MRPAAQSLVLLRKRKVTKRKAPQLSAPPAGAAGTCGARFGRGLAKLAFGSNNASPFPPKAVLLGAYRWGPKGAGSARLSRASRRSRIGGSIGGCGITPNISWRTDPASCPRHDGALRAPDCDPGVPLCKAPRSTAPRGSAGRVFERSEFASCPRGASTAGSPSRERRGAGSGGGLFFGDFLLATQKTSYCPAGGTSRPGIAVARTAVHSVGKRFGPCTYMPGSSRCANTVEPAKCVHIDPQF